MRPARAFSRDARGTVMLETMIALMPVLMLFLGTVISDEARHIEAFTRRALANGGGLQYSSALTSWSLHTLLVQEDYFRFSFLLHVLGEGTFLDLLEFIERPAPGTWYVDVVNALGADLNGSYVLTISTAAGGF